MNNHLIIDYDLEVRIRSIQQKYTYEGLLEGLPTKEMNKNRIQRFKQEAERFCGMSHIHLIEPIETPIHYNGTYPFGEPAQLPSIICIMEVGYYKAFRDMEKDYSRLGIIFFQNDFAFPIDSEILEKIKQIPYRQICGEFEY
ncbi:hypothetical protein AD998_02895 [bacterium 336/3]|nr:hypothetical protein AD998_02895 [bacterium 336/3]